jgi:hypothetical protein
MVVGVGGGHLASGVTTTAGTQRSLLAGRTGLPAKPSAAAVAFLGLVAVFSIHVWRNGEVLNVYAAERSGGAALDAAVVSSIREAGQLPPLPRDLPGNFVSVRVLLSLKPEGFFVGEERSATPEQIVGRPAVSPGRALP